MFLELKLKTIRLKTQKKLSNRNLSLYKSMISYLKNSDLRDIEKEEVLQQIIDMLLEAQQDGKPAEIIIGNDYEAFCQSIIDEVEGSKSIVYRVLSFVQRYFVCIFTIIGIFIVVNSMDIGMVNLEISINELYSANIFVLILIPFARKSRQKSAIIPLRHRLFFFTSNFSKNSIGLSLGILIFMAVFLRFLFKTIFNENIFTYSFHLNRYFPYIIGMIAVIIAIEIYKRIVA